MNIDEAAQFLNEVGCHPHGSGLDNIEYWGKLLETLECLQDNEEENHPFYLSLAAEIIRIATKYKENYVEKVISVEYKKYETM